MEEDEDVVSSLEALVSQQVGQLQLFPYQLISDLGKENRFIIKQL